jgi:hypothetical protein
MLKESEDQNTEDQEKKAAEERKRWLERQLRIGW